jgi:hypothetical protein
LISADSVLSSPIIGSSEERHYLDFFHAHTSRALAGTFATGFWTQVLPQLSHSEPAIRHALLAVSSLHAQLDDSGQGKQVVVGKEFSLKQYNRAIAALQDRLRLASRDGGEATDTVLVCCLLFIVLECLRGNREVTLTHLQNGLSILAQHAASRPSQRLLQSSTTTPSNPSDIHATLAPIFSRLDTQLTLFGKPVSDEELTAAFQNLPRVTCAFGSVLEAKSYMDTLIGLSLRFVHSVITRKFGGVSPTQDMYARQFELLAGFWRWQCAFETLMLESDVGTWAGNSHGQHAMPPLSPQLQREALLLRIRHKSSFIWLSTCLDPSELAFDTHVATFEGIITYAKALLQLPAQPTCPGSTASSGTGTGPAGGASGGSAGGTGLPSFTLDMALIPALYLTAIKCRTSWIRRSAISLLHSLPGREGLWDARIHARVAERVVGIEEAGRGMGMEMGIGLSGSGDGGDGDGEGIFWIPPEEARVYNAQIVTERERTPERTVVTFFTRPEGVEGAWTTWKETIPMD